MNTAHLVDADEGPQGYGGFTVDNDLTVNDETEDRTDNLIVFGPNATPWLDEDFDESLPKKLILSEQLKQFSDRNHPNYEYQVCLLIAKTFQMVIEEMRKNKNYQCAYKQDLPRFLCWLNSYRVLYLPFTVLRTCCQVFQNHSVNGKNVWRVYGYRAWTFAVALWDEQPYIDAHQGIRKFIFSGPRLPNGRLVVSYQKTAEQRGGGRYRKTNYSGVNTDSKRKDQLIWVRPPGMLSVQLMMQTYEFETAQLLATTNRPLREEEEEYLNEYRTGKLLVMMKLLVCRTNF
jgi:hypothetical protein